MWTPGIDPRLIAHNTPAHRTIWRTSRIVRQNYAQCFESRLEDGGILPKNRPRPALIGRPYRRFSHGWGWDPTSARAPACSPARAVSSIGTANRRKGLPRLDPWTAPLGCQIGSRRNRPLQTRGKPRFRQPMAFVRKGVPYLTSEATKWLMDCSPTFGPPAPSRAAPLRGRALSGFGGRPMTQAQAPSRVRGPGRPGARPRDGRPRPRLFRALRPRRPLARAPGRPLRRPLRARGQWRRNDVDA